MAIPEATFHILIALAQGQRHGYAIIQEVEAATGGKLRLGAGTLYRALQRMLEQGLIAETIDRPAPADDDERRRYYRITEEGRTAASAEARRLAGMVRLAESRGI
jgi:DNA-binding PadR family transcriptional regulator